MSTETNGGLDEVVIGHSYRFKGYSLDFDGEHILQPGERVTAVRPIPEEQGIFAVHADRLDDQNRPVADSVMIEELEPLDTPPAVQAAGKRKVRIKKKAKQAPVATVAAAPARLAPEPEAEEEDEAVEHGRAALERLPAVPARGLVGTIEVGGGPPILEVDLGESVQNLIDQSQDAVEAARSLVRRQAESSFTLGGVLYHIYRNGLFRYVGYDGKRGFTTFLDTELGMAYRTAMDLIRIYTVFRYIGVDEEQLAEIGWSKAKEIATIGRIIGESGELIGPRILEENVTDLLEFARTHRREDLVQMIRTEYLRVSPAQVEANAAIRQKVTRFAFALYGEAGDIVTRAVQFAQAQIGNSDQPNDVGPAVEHICGEWLLANEGTDLALEQAVRFVEQRFGVRLRLAGETEPAEDRAEAAAAQ